MRVCGFPVVKLAKIRVLLSVSQSERHSNFATHHQMIITTHPSIPGKPVAVSAYVVHHRSWYDWFLEYANH